MSQPRSKFGEQHSTHKQTSRRPGDARAHQDGHADKHKKTLALRASSNAKDRKQERISRRDCDPPGEDIPIVGHDNPVVTMQQTKSYFTQVVQNSAVENRLLKESHANTGKLRSMARRNAQDTTLKILAFESVPAIRLSSSEKRYS